MKKLSLVRPAALIAMGVFLGRGAQADTVLDFEAVPPSQPNYNPVVQTFGDTATNSSPGVTVTGFGTPNIDLSWKATGAADARWDYYNDQATFNVWSAAQLNSSVLGSVFSVNFAPNSASARAVVKSFNFHPYYDSTERYTYSVSVVADGAVVSGPTQVSFLANALKNHPVSINYTGAVGQTLKLRIARVPSTLTGNEVEGGQYNIAVDDIAFAQLPQTIFPTGPQVVSVSPDEDVGVAAVKYPYSASITNGDRTLSAASIQLRLDGALVTPTITSAGGMTNVSYLGTNLVASGSTHLYQLTYNDNLGTAYTNVVRFTAFNYPTLPASYALPPGAGITRGFTYRTVLAEVGTNTLASTVARAEAQLNGTLINPETNQPYTNSATLGTNADGSFSVDEVVNFNDFGNVQGNFTNNETAFPGLDAGPNNWFSTEGRFYLDLAPGYYRLGVNSDDGFAASVVPPQGVPGAAIPLGAFSDGRAADNTTFDLLVTTSGVYPFRVIYFESDGSASEEFYSENLVSGQLLLINDPTEINAIKSYRVLRPRVSRIARSGSNVIIDWAYGTPPFQLQSASNFPSTNWVNVGSPTSNRTATVPIQPGNAFFRVLSQ